TQTGGILGGKGTLTVNGAFTWSAGTQAETGQTVIASGGTLTINGTGPTLGSGRTLQVNSGGTATMQGEGTRVLMGENAQLVNAGTFNANSSEASFGGGIVDVGGGGGLVHNTGTFTRNGTGV